MAAAYLSAIFHVIVAALCASTYWKAAQMEEGPSALLWSLASVAVFIITWLLLDWSWPALIGAQVAIGLIIGIVRAILYLRDTRQNGH